MIQLLNEYRDKIDKIDFELVELLKKRADVSKKIGILKKNNGLNICDETRENEIIDRIVKESGFDENYIKEIFKLILSNSKKIQEIENGKC